MNPRHLAITLFLGCVTAAVASTGHPTTAPSTDGFPWLWLLVALNALPLALKIPVAIAHAILFVAVLRDRPPTPPRFAPQFVWALATLVGGFVALTVYWLMHHAHPAEGSATPPKGH